MSNISIAVTIGAGGKASYSSASKQVAPDGTITINAGESASITFAPASGQSWTFNNPGISIMSNTPGIQDVSITSQSANAVTIADVNSGSSVASSYTYTLLTTAGNLDPAILNKGRH